MPSCHSCAWLEHLRDQCELEPGYPNGCDAWRPKTPTPLQGVACVVIILSFQTGLNWMDQASNADLTWVGLGVAVFWILAFWLTRREQT